MRTDLSRTPLRPSAVRQAIVVPGGLWTEVDVVPETGSTNGDLVAAVLSGAPEGTVRVAERQVAGRGRLDRQWHAPAHAALTFSVLLRPPTPPARSSWLPLLAGLALVDAVRPAPASLKWPNDLLVRTPDGTVGKCAGILAEAVADAVVIGIGLNVDQRADELPPPPDALGFPPVSLALASFSFDRTELLAAVLGALADRYRRFCDADGDPFAAGLVEAYRLSCATLGRDVTVMLPGGSTVQGVAEDVDADGRLVVATGSGPRTLAAGDVRHVR